MGTTPEIKVADERGPRWAGLEWPRFAGWQWKVLVLLTVVNLLNYFDRLIVFPMFAYLKDEFTISDFKLGLLGSVFILVNSISVLPLGYWSDRGPRKKIMAGGVLFWSFATALSGFAATFKTLVAARALVGVGEAAYAPGGTAMMTWCFPRRFRARVQSIFNLGMLVGGVMGLAVGGMLSEWVGWRSAFFLVGLPGFALAISIDRLRIPVPMPAEPMPPVRSLLKIPAYLMILLGGMFVVFSSSAFASWGVEFSARYHGMSVAEASLSLGTLVLVGSLGGVFLGGYVADRLQDRWPWGRAVTIGATLLIGTPFLYVAVVTDSRTLFLFCLFMATFMLTCYHGPVTAVIHDLTTPRAHAFAFALYLFFIHLFGDAIAPALVGRVSDVSDLRRGMMIAVGANLVAALCFFLVTHLVRRRAAGNNQPAAGG
jgi:MFS transporter, Spinster family, sphingosine-1-phosphate transporter